MTLFENTLKLRGFLVKDADVPPSQGITEDAFAVLFLATVSESSSNANVGWLSGRTSSSKGSVSASKQYQKQKEPLFEENVFFDLKNAQSIIVAFDGISPLPPTYCYLKPDFLPIDMTWFDQERIAFDPRRVQA